MLTGIGDFLRSAQHDGKVGNIDNTLQVRHPLIIELCRYHVAYKEQAGIGVIHHIIYLVRSEFMLNRNSYGTVGERC